MNNIENSKIAKLKKIYDAFHAKMRDIIKRQSDLIEKIGKYCDGKKIEEVRSKIKNL